MDVSGVSDQTLVGPFFSLSVCQSFPSYQLICSGSGSLQTSLKLFRPERALAPLTPLTLSLQVDAELAVGHELLLSSPPPPTMRPSPTSPRTGLPAVLAFTLAALFPPLTSGAAPFPQDLEPLSHVGRESKLRGCGVAMAMWVAAVVLKAEQSVPALR